MRESTLRNILVSYERKRDKMNNSLKPKAYRIHVLFLEYLAT